MSPLLELILAASLMCGTPAHSDCVNRAVMACASAENPSECLPKHIQPAVTILRGNTRRD